MAWLTSEQVAFRAVLARHVTELERAQPERDSIAWFFLRYLKRLRSRTEEFDSVQMTEGAMRGLVRFYAENIAPDSALGARFDEVLAAQRAALRSETEQRGRGDPALT